MTTILSRGGWVNSYTMHTECSLFWFPLILSIITYNGKFWDMTTRIIHSLRCHFIFMAIRTHVTNVFSSEIQIRCNFSFPLSRFLILSTFTILHIGRVEIFVALTVKRIFHGIDITSENSAAKWTLGCGWTHGNELTGPLLTMDTYHRHHLTMTGLLLTMTTYHM